MRRAAAKVAASGASTSNARGAANTAAAGSPSDRRAGFETRPVVARSARGDLDAVNDARCEDGSSSACSREPYLWLTTAWVPVLAPMPCCASTSTCTFTESCSLLALEAGVSICDSLVGRTNARRNAEPKWCFELESDCARFYATSIENPGWHRLCVPREGADGCDSTAPVYCDAPPTLPPTPPATRHRRRCPTLPTGVRPRRCAMWRTRLRGRVEASGRACGATAGASTAPRTHVLSSECSVSVSRASKSMPRPRRSPPASGLAAAPPPRASHPRRRACG